MKNMLIALALLVPAFSHADSPSVWIGEDVIAANLVVDPGVLECLNKLNNNGKSGKLDISEIEILERFHHYRILGSTVMGDVIGNRWIVSVKQTSKPEEGSHTTCTIDKNDE